MKKVRIIYFAGIILFAACTNNNSSNVGTYENDETSSSVNKEADTSKEANLNSNTKNAGEASINTAKNITGVSRDSVTSKSKKDTSFAAEKINVKRQKSKKVDSKH